MAVPSRRILGRQDMIYLLAVIWLMAAVFIPVLADQKKTGISPMPLFFLGIPVLVCFTGLMILYVNVLAGLPRRRWVILVIPAFLIAMVLAGALNAWLGPIGRGEPLGRLFLKLNIGGLWRGMVLITTGAVYGFIGKLLHGGAKKLLSNCIQSKVRIENIASALSYMLLAPLFFWTIINLALWSQHHRLGWKELLYCYAFLDGLILLFLSAIFILTRMAEGKK
ncbi:hypothetical protein LLG95_08585 [bacterium]|nr:hypothetical protein [bacterium]